MCERERARERARARARARARERERERERETMGQPPAGGRGKERRSTTATNSARIVGSRASVVSVQFKSKSEYAKTKAATKRRTHKTVRDM